MTDNEAPKGDIVEDIITESRRRLAAGLLFDMTAGSRDHRDREVLEAAHRRETGSDEPSPEEQRELLELHRGAHHAEEHQDGGPKEDIPG